MSSPRETSTAYTCDDNEPNPAATTPSSATITHDLKPGIYWIINDHVPTSAIDLSGYDKKTIIAYGAHGGANQQWEFARMGPGYSIRSVHNKAYITLASGINAGGTMIASPYPVSWVVEPDDLEAGIYRIRWPMSPFVFDLPEGQDYAVQLCNRYPFKETRLWRLVLVSESGTEESPEDHNSPDVLEFATSAPLKLEPGPPLVTTADTVIDVEGLKLGGNGEMSITTTTTTVTTSVTVVKRIGVR